MRNSGVSALERLLPRWLRDSYRSLRDEGDHFTGSRCLPQAALPIGGIFMRVKDDNAPRRGAHPARQRVIGSIHTPSTVAAVVAGILGAAGLAVTGSVHAQDAQNAQAAQSAPTTLAAAPTSTQ